MAIPLRILLVASLAAAGSCKGREDLDGRRVAPAGLPERAPVHTLASDGEVAYDFFDNRAAAVVVSGGALRIDLGGIDAATFAEGMYRSPWRTDVRVDGESAALVPGLGAELYVPIDADPGGVARGTGGSVRITVRARPAAPQQLVSVFLNEHRLGDLSMPEAGWGEYRIEAPAEVVREGENKLRFWFRHAGDLAGERTAAAISTVGIGGRGLGAAMTAGPVTREGTLLDALALPGPGRISYYVRVPDGAPHLIVASGTGAAASIRIDGDRSGDAELWSAADGAAGWRDLDLDLSAWAGEVARIDFIGQGPAAWGRPRLVRPAPARPEGPGFDTADHVIIWVVSSLRADRVGGDVPTPAFEALAGRGVRFTRAQSAAPSPGPAHVAMMTGTHPEGSSIPAGVATLGERFRAAGFATALLSGNGFVHDEAGFARGFDLYDNPMRRRYPHGARQLWTRARRFLRTNADGRSLVYLATVEPHLPYTPSDESLAAEWAAGRVRPFPATATATVSEQVRSGRRALTGDERAWIEALYDAEIRDADAAFAGLLTDLDELGIADRTAIILVGDHGEALFERGGFGHGNDLHRESLDIPLIIAAPGLAPGERPAAVSGMDLFATALALAGVSPGPDDQGQSALAGPAEPAIPQPVFATLPGRARALHLGRFRLVVPGQGGHELYDLDADPGERTNLMGDRPLVERYLRTVFGLGVAYERAWSRRRWGTPANMAPAFGADHGL